MITKYNGLEEIRKGLEKVVTKETVFVCVGSSIVTFDKFGPLMGELLRERNIPYYGDCHHNVNAITMDKSLHQIYDIDKIDNENIIAIDAAVTSYDNEKNNIIMKEGLGVKPGAGLGKIFPIIGVNSILLFTLNRRELDQTMGYYKQSLFMGKSRDLANKKIMKRYAVALADMIEEIYNKACQEVYID